MNSAVINLQYTTIKTPLPDFIYHDLYDYCKKSNLYHPQPPELIEKLAQKYKLSPQMIYLTAGIDEALHLLFLAYGQSTYIFVPTYIVHSQVEMFGGKLNQIKAIQGNDFMVPVNKIDSATLILLANPNNPAGFTAKEKVTRLVKNNPQVLVVIDEAYAEFANLSVIDQLIDCPNLVVLRSFSKAYASAGARVGFMAAAPTVISKIKGKSQWCNVSYLSVGAAISALNHENYFVQIREEINRLREKFVTFLKNHQFLVFPSRINAVLLKFTSQQEATRFVNYLSQANIIVNQGNGNSNVGLDDSFVRIAIGTSEQVNQIKKIISSYQG